MSIPLPDIGPRYQCRIIVYVDDLEINGEQIQRYTIDIRRWYLKKSDNQWYPQMQGVRIPLDYADGLCSRLLKLSSKYKQYQGRETNRAERQQFNKKRRMNLVFNEDLDNVTDDK